MEYKQHPNVLEDLQDAVVRGLDDTAYKVVIRAIPLANIRDGYLRGSIRAMPAKRQGDICLVQLGSYNIIYNAAQEFGPHGKPYLRPALSQEVTAEKLARRIKNHHD